ncbi:MAG: hypothetical protein J6A59_15975, partial [Lachnospiraceae bacterium]|nr:hypothetical protein [Lachnospiraceae bacterium]
MIKDFEYMYRRENNIIIKGIADEDITRLMLEVVKAITDGIQGWQGEYIFWGDDRELASTNGNRAYAILEPDYWNAISYREAGSSVAGQIPIGDANLRLTDPRRADLKKLDLAALLKLLDKRLFWINRHALQSQIIADSRRYESFRDLINYIRGDMRNLSSHTTTEDLEEKFADNQSIYDNLLKLKRLIDNAKNDCEAYLVRGARVKALLEDFVNEQLEPMIMAYYKAKIGDTITYQLDKDFFVEDLATYNVLVDYSIFLQEDGYKAIDSLIVKGKTIFAEQSLLDRLENTQIQGASSNKEKAKDVIRTLELWVESHKLILLENANVIEKLSQAANAKWCVLTQDYDLANQVWDLGKENV